MSEPPFDFDNLVADAEQQGIDDSADLYEDILADEEAYVAELSLMYESDSDDSMHVDTDGFLDMTSYVHQGSGPSEPPPVVSNARGILRDITNCS